MPCLPGSVAVAHRISLPSVRDQRQLDNDTISFDVPAVWTSGFCYSWDDLPPNPDSATSLVPSVVVDD